MQNNQKPADNKGEVKFETVKSEVLSYGKNSQKFIEIARKKAITPEATTEFVNVVMGYFDNANQKKYKAGHSVSFPVDKLLVKSVCDKLQMMV